MSIEQPLVEQKFTQEDLEKAATEFTAAENNLNEVDFSSDDYDETKAAAAHKKWQETRARYHEISEALGVEH